MEIARTTADSKVAVLEEQCRSLQGDLLVLLRNGTLPRDVKKRLVSRLESDLKKQRIHLEVLKNGRETPAP